MDHKWFHLVDLDGAALGSTTVVSVGTEDVAAFRDAVITECRNVLAHIDAFQLIVHESQVAFNSAHPPLDADANIGLLGNARKDALVVVAPIRRTQRTPTNVGIQPAPSNVLWFGSKKATCLMGRQTLPRTSLTDEVIRRLEVHHVLLVAGPPMTGKTTLATLVCRDLQTLRLQQNERITIASFSSGQMEEHESFYGAFQRQCEISWGRFISLMSDGYTVYFVIDEAHELYTSDARVVGVCPPESHALWRLVKGVLNDGGLRARVLLLAAYRGGVQYCGYSAWVEFPKELVVNSEQLELTTNEIREYVATCFIGAPCLGAATAQFCGLLQAVTGGHVGLCAAVIRVLKELAHCRSDSPMTAHEWMTAIATGSLGGRLLSHAVTSCRAVQALNTIATEDVFECLERLLYGGRTMADNATLDRCELVGVLVPTGCYELKFASPVLWRRFIKMRVAHIPRAANENLPTTLEGLLRQSLRAMDFATIRTAQHGAFPRSAQVSWPQWQDLAFERAWQMELYKAIYRCTPRTVETSVDSGALFGSPAFLDLTVQSGDQLWGIEVVRHGVQGASTLAACAERVARDGAYSVLQLSDYCLLDFQRVESIDDVASRADAMAAAGLKRMVVCYDGRLSHVSVVYGRETWRLV